ncbi:TIGR02391 family protein [Candidatus Woesearchaeota archaeon]|mgnify:CR=1 FL=1|jgi:uncharacterized protein (TIGR02391 family)|nr:TIGR02391 family protein [Candidatus Woesearchaeota archaeon]MBT4368483.1 TIGR02391 family protein [Candidatus Woesearchaeota archaeon]MBT4712972.1 TIGR02391 family protein [Candidatus Woesearchaeota archaeon]MBT6639884.1 TIGR02391 family protein [Candidatus Woesearchaeota archaeon]MBT7134056.1 TIGR02391 family protein [Candidatus Woesearchaeota archaeon]
MLKEKQYPELILTFTPNTIEHLGVRMYSTAPPVIAELVANSYDADATEVHIHLKDKVKKEIVISDNGHGMSFQDINDKFLRIGRNRRTEEESQTSPKGRKVIGKKGLGKLSFFGIAQEIEVQTIKDGKKNSFLMRWTDITKKGDKTKQRDYAPTILEFDVKNNKPSGTSIILRSINRVSDFDANTLANSLSKIFITEPDFKIYVKHNENPDILIDNKRKYSQLEPQVKWNIPKDIDLESQHNNIKLIKGQLLATKKPISPNTHLRGITLFSRKKLVNAPEYFSDSTSSHFFSYLTGWLEVDFIDDLEEDVIGTNRQSLNWGNKDMIELRKQLQDLLRWLEKDWRKKRSEIREENIEKTTGVKISEWFDKLPKKLRQKVKPIVESIVRESELPDEVGTQAVKNFHEIVPEYPFYHWRNLHPEVRFKSEKYYKTKDYYTALSECAKRYLNAVKVKTSSPLIERNLLESVFSIKDPILSVTNKFKKPDGKEFESKTIVNINEGHRMLAIALWTAFRCPIAHEEVVDLRKSGLFTEKDCLDALSLLSHLFHRLDGSEVITNSE